ncbi:MAG: ankyrin repeat domain-containing protein [Gammaproteobacteria bacterium]|jgi:ankyrin repeat protein
MRASTRVLAAVLATIGLAAVAHSAEPGALLDAARRGSTAELAALLADGADPQTAEADGTSALHWAVHHGDAQAAVALLGAGAAVDSANRYGVRPSYLAAENGDAAMLQTLIEAGADPDAVFAEGETLLMTAARTGDVATVEALIAAGADVDATESRGGQTALMWAAAENNGPAVAALVEAGAARDAREATGEFSALGFAVRAGAVDSAHALLEAGADPNETLLDGTSLLVLAAHNANYDVASTLLDYGADPNLNVKGWTALHEIALVRRWNRGFNLPGPEQDDDLPGLELVHELAAHAADVNARQTERIDGGGGLNQPGTTPFLLAARSLDLPYMRTLLDAGADASLTTDGGTSAVMVAAGVGQGIGSAGSSPGSVEEALAALELALEAGGGTVNDVDANNETPMHGVMYRGASIELIDFLVERGAGLEGIVNSRGWTPLRIADGVGLDGLAFVRYPEAAARLREHMRARGVPVPPVEWDGPSGEVTTRAR